jgi:protein O-mannosyl-transferase
MPRDKARRKPPGSAAAPRRSDSLPFLALLAVTLLVYGNTLANGLVHDDKPLVERNLFIRDPANLPRVFTSGYWTTRDPSVPELYRPLTVASFALNFLGGGPGAFGFHLVNLLLQAWVCFLVFRLGRDLASREAAGWGAALLFAVHPVHSEAVAPVVGRSELLSTGFALWALVLHRRARGSDRAAGAFAPAGAFAGAALFYFASILSKENALILPALLLLSDLAFPPAAAQRRERRRLSGGYLLYLLSAAIYLALRVSVLGGITKSDIRPLDNPIAGAGFVTARLTAIITLGKYLFLLFVPWRLSADYSRDQIPLASGWADPRLIVSLLALLAAGLLAAWSWRRRRLVSASILFFAASILPVSNFLFPIGTIFGERLLYLPSVGFCLLAGAVFAPLRDRWKAAAALGAILLILGAVRTVARNRVWHDDASFALATAADSPRSAKAQFNLGVFLEEHGRLQEALDAYARAAALAPEWGDPPYNRGGILLRLGRPGEAAADLRRSAELSPGEPRFRVNLGVALNRAGRYQEAVELYEGMIRGLSSPAPDVWNNLGVNLIALGRNADAAGAFKNALSLDPGNASYHANLGQAEEAAGDLRTAESEYRTALASLPDTPQLLRSLGLLLARRGEKEEAGRLLRRAEALIPGGLDPEASAVLRSLP